MNPDTGSMDRRVPVPGDGLTATREPAQPTEHGPAGQVTVEIHRGVVPPVVVVTGRLGREGGALLAALLGHVRSQSGGQVVVDLRRVTYVDRLGLAPILAAGTVIGSASPVVDEELCALAGEPARVGRRRRSLAAMRHRGPTLVVP
jgi:hypothetical protein